MKIGIVEICEANHYTAVLALVQTYLVDPLNKVTIFTTGKIKPLFNEIAKKVEVITIKEEQNVKEFLSIIASYPLDRIHINTISKYYSEFAYTTWPNNIYFTIHNIDLWYDNKILSRVKTLISDYRSKPQNLKLPLILFIKDFWRQYYRDRFIERISKGEYRIIVYSQSQKKHLEKYLKPDNILVFPFCLHTDFKDLSPQSPKLRFCIPGSVSNQRRNYSALFQMLRMHLSRIKQDFTIDLLGYIPEDNRFLIDEIESLKSEGFDIIYNERFIGVEEFDERLNLCDIILRNLKVQMNVFRKYGETKETGIIFNIIKSGKPGIMPYDYPVDEELKDICIFFHDYHNLSQVIINLHNNREFLEQLKLRAKVIVQQYKPENLYHLLNT